MTEIKVIDIYRESRWAIAAEKAELQERRKRRIKAEQEMEKAYGTISWMFASPFILGFIYMMLPYFK